MNNGFGGFANVIIVGSAGRGCKFFGKRTGVNGGRSPPLFPERMGGTDDLPPAVCYDLGDLGKLFSTRKNQQEPVDGQETSVKRRSAGRSPAVG